MDIQVASNFERYLFYLYDQDPLKVRSALAGFARNGRLTFTPAERRQVSAEFRSMSVDDDGIIDEIRSFHGKTGYVLDPHTAVGVRAGRTLMTDDVPMLCLATAHPAKFPDAVHQAIGRNPDRPASLDGLEERPRRCETIDAATDVVKTFVARHAL
jgi:threonine synthase